MQHFLPSIQTGVSPSVQLIIVPEGQHPLELVVELPELDPLELGQQQLNAAPRGQYGGFNISPNVQTNFNVQPGSQQPLLELEVLLPLDDEMH